MSQPRELNWWIKSTQVIRTLLNPHIAKYNEKYVKKLSGTVHVTIARLLKDSNLLTPTLSPSESDIMNEFNKYISTLESEEKETIEEEPIAEESAKLKEERILNLLSQILEHDNIEVIVRRKRTCCLW